MSFDLLDLVLEPPTLAPHLDYRLLEGDQAILVSETFNTLLHGALYADLLPLLDGERRLADLTDALAEKHPATEVQTALAALARRGYVVTGSDGMARGAAAYWSAQDIAPRRAAARLQAARVQVTGDDGALTRRLAELGVGVVAEAPTLRVVVCADYLDEDHAEFNQARLADGGDWLLLRPRGLEPLFGPVFRPAQQGPCWLCLSHRMRGHQEVHNFLRNRGGDANACRPVVELPALQDTVYGLAAAEIARWLVFGDQAQLHEHAISVDLARLGLESHRVQRRPQCFACGDEFLYRPDRPALPLRLESCPGQVRNSGGLRSVTPEETLERYRHLVSPVSGIVSKLERTTSATDPWLHVYWSGSNVYLDCRRLDALRRSLRGKSMGKGSTPSQSEASALCEAIERYCLGFHEDEIRTRRSYAEFVSAGEDEAIEPNVVQLFSERQLDNAEQLNARRLPFNAIPARLDPQTQTSWTPVWSFTQQRHRYLPTAILYGIGPGHPENPGLFADSNGCAAGNTLEEAIIQGFYELVERDAFALWWYNCLSMPGVDLASFDDAYLAAAEARYREHGRDLWLLDLTNDLDIPVYVAVSRRTDIDEDNILYGAGAHADPLIAAQRAVCEANQFLSYLINQEEKGSKNDDPAIQGWLDTRLADHPYLAPAPGSALRTRSDHALPDTTDLHDEVERCRALVEARGLEFLVLDMTSPDVGLPVARVVVPGLRHFWERLAPGRLYDVPPQLGWREAPMTEAEVNPTPVIV